MWLALTKIYSWENDAVRVKHLSLENNAAILGYCQIQSDLFVILHANHTLKGKVTQF